MSPKKIFIVSLLVTIVVGFFCISNLVLADEFGLETTAHTAGLMRGQQDLPTLAGNILGTALSFIGVLFFALMVFGGFMWMTARGNEEQTKKALNTITAAVIGLIIVLSSYTITSFVFKSVGIQKGGSASVSDGGMGADAACLAFEGFSCNEITDCSNIKPTAEITSIEIEHAQALCNANGTSNCKTGLCGNDNTKVCCKPKDPSEETTDWCFDSKTATCTKLAEVGVANCDNSNQVKNKTEKECYNEKIIKDNNFNCSNSGSKGNCATSFTGLICVDGKCKVQSSADGNNKSCKSTADCKTGVCKAGECTYLPPCPKNAVNSGTLTCSYRACGDKSSCTSDSQCGINSENTLKAGGRCVNGKCESGEEGSSCSNDNHCQEGLYCTSQGRPSCCLKKLDHNEKCFGMHNACKSGHCIDKPGYDRCQ